MSISSGFHRRLQKDLQNLTEDLDVKSYFHYESSGFQNNEPRRPFLIYGCILPRTYPYMYGSFKIQIKLTRDYAFKRPELIFLTRIYHTNVYECGGELIPFCCHDDAPWTPATFLSKLIEEVVRIIDGINPTKQYYGRNDDAEQHRQRNSDDYWKTVMNWIEKYACRRTNESTISLKFAAKRLIRTQLAFDSTKINQLPISKTLKEYLHIPFDRK